MFPVIPAWPILDTPMCNLYSQTKSQDAMRHVFDDMVDGDEVYEDLVGNLPPMAGIFPDYAAPIIRPRIVGGTPHGWQLTRARWGMPTPQVFLEGKRTDPGVTNIRNVGSPHWRRWLTAPAADALQVQRPLPDGMLQIVAEGLREDAV